MMRTDSRQSVQLSRARDVRAVLVLPTHSMQNPSATTDVKHLLTL